MCWNVLSFNRSLKSKDVPHSYQLMIINLFGSHLNVLVISIFLSTRKLGFVGALDISIAALILTTASMFKLKSRSKDS